jgi:hypothetical protein
MYVMACVMVAGVAAGCGDDATEADRIGVGAECTVDPSADPPSTCPVVQKDEMDIQLECLPFKGGYCGIEGCEGDAACPEGSACVTHDDGKNYCFRECTVKPDCNRNRPTCEANCVGSVTFVDLRNERKACEPPSATDC